MSEVVTGLPEARVVSPLARARPRRVPWLATIYMIGPASAGVASALAVGVFFCAVLTGGRYGSPHVFDPSAEEVLGTLGMEWAACAVLLLGAAAFSQRRFLRHAHVIEGVINRGEVTVTLDGRLYRIDSVVPELPDGTRVPLFWRGSRVVELAKAGAALAGDGEVSWDAKPYPYRWLAVWPVTVLATVVASVAMIVWLGLAFL